MHYLVGWLKTSCALCILPMSLCSGFELVQPALPLSLGVLFDQTNTCTASMITSQIFDPPNALYDDAAADDFDVPAGTTWEVTQVYASGTYFNGPGPTPHVDVRFFGPGTGGTPGSPIDACGYADVDTFADASGKLTIALPKTCKLFGGAASRNYWLSVRARMDSAQGQWFWYGSSPQYHNQAEWQNPGGGFRTPCSTWSGIPGCTGGPTDLCFSITGGSNFDIVFQDGFEQQ